MRTQLSRLLFTAILGSAVVTIDSSVINVALPAPFGVSFTGMACSEPTLLKLAYAFEQATKKRVPPPSTP